MGIQKKEAKEKPLDKMTTLELRDLAKKETDLQGIVGMNKAELIAAISKARGITLDAPKKSSSSVREIKQKMRALKVDRENAIKEQNVKMAMILRKRILRLKKMTRRVG
ncbi:MAG: Rho termination factor N-terminal domain-containing protein [Thermodesulfobacteriota bacterium]